MSNRSSNKSTKKKLLLTGDGGVGKSACTVRYLKNTFLESWDPSVLEQYHHSIVVDGESYEFEIIDTAGQEEYDQMKWQYYKEADGFMLIYSIDSKGSFDELNKVYKEIQRAKDGEEFPFILVGNKSDLSSQRQVKEEEAQKFASGSPCMETSAKTGESVALAFETAAARIINFKSNSNGNKKKKGSGSGGGGCLIM